MDFLANDSIAIVGRLKNGIILDYGKTVYITTDILKTNENQKPTSITLNKENESIIVYADDILLESTSNKNSKEEAESIVYGESLVELLTWMIQKMMEHKHPPNAPPIPTWFSEAQQRISNMEKILLNKNVKSQ